MAAAKMQSGEEEGIKMEETWGSLVSLIRSKDGRLEEGNTIKMVKKEVTIGRCKECDIAHTDNKLLSSYHCKFIHDESQKKIFLCDTSKNGTLVDNAKVKNKTVEVSDSSVIQCVHKKSEPHLDVTYRLKINKVSSSKNADCKLDATLDADATQDHDADTEEENDTEEVEETRRKRPATSPSPEETASKIPKNERRDSECKPKPSQEPAKKIDDSDREMEENLTCGICQDIFHDCISAQPCMHSFCASCYSIWMVQSRKCPSCRKTVKQVGKNHIVNNLVAAFIKKHPDRQRSEDELKEMDRNNKIKGDTVKVESNGDEVDQSGYETDDPSTEYETDGSDSDSDYIHDDIDALGRDCPFPIILPPVPLYRAPSVFLRPAGSQCLQCTGFAVQNASCQGIIDNSIASFRCAPGQDHILCSCCNQFFPDRRGEAASSRNWDIQCSSCRKLSCHLYWGCRKPGCLGCLNKFEDFNFGNASLTRIINNNQFESIVLKDYLAQKNIDVKELLRICVEKLKASEYTVVQCQPGLSSTDILCFSCGLRCFKELVYQYRKDIPNEDLPTDVANRSDCYWGKNCRTQHHNPMHASRYNHVCEQTRYV
eukprot:Seg2876.1 transcript_id=Seg2876.1/GoldUCD/mRNA.D3Y31 product="E3 ubiquitin-protein ligase CHFR" protein_id=Seg2876.1/GoldUCD/D3Y31